MVEQTREGQILLSFPGFGPITAVTIRAAIGSIHHFPLAWALNAYVGWAPVVAQSGSTLDASSLTRGGARTIKQIMLLAVMQVIRTALVVPVMCLSQASWSSPPFLILYAQNDFSARVPLSGLLKRLGCL
ncbi:IS110 family transposase [Dictyobacter formicarum]|uniref:IS110 family transposase n=1 Tax=Dictyobacter formicarum TaxID=2778368 RepID=UPI0035711D28